MAKLLMLLFLAATLKSSFGAICPNPQAYSGQSLCDPWGTYCGECVSFYKVFHFIFYIYSYDSGFIITIFLNPGLLR
jgi:hypothetical protein